MGNFSAWVLLPLLFASLGLLLAMHFHARNVPTNYLLLIGFTTIQALTLGCVGKEGGLWDLKDKKS